MSDRLSWLGVGLSVLAIGVYELRLLRAARRDPASTARSAHRLLRGEWVGALSQRAGTEILAVQALRNSLMSATITASTAALSLMGAVSLIASQADAAGPWFAGRPLSTSLVLELGLTFTLFAAHVCAAMAMRYYHHAGFLVSLPVGSPERAAREPLAASYVQRAGTLYSWSLRCFLFVAPIAVGLLSPLLMPLSAVALLGVMRKFDRAPEPFGP